MAGKVVSYETKNTNEAKPRTLHGVKEVPMLVVQCADRRGNVQVLLGIEIEPGDIRMFPSDTWEKLGRPMGWLQEQIDEVRHGKILPKAATTQRAPQAPIAAISADPMV